MKVPRVSPSHFDGRGLPTKCLNIRRPVTDDDVPEADVVVATWWETAEWVLGLRPEKGAKAYFIQHFECHAGLPADRVRATWRFPFHKIVISEWLRRLAKDEFSDDSVSVIFNSVDTTQFYSEVREKQRVASVGLLYATVGWKGCDVSFRALEKVREKVPGVRIIAFGMEDRPTHPVFLQSDTYFQNPPQTKLRELYGQCDVWLCGSRSEGFHLPPLEAMACRCPVVSTRVGGPEDTIRDGENGFLVDIEDSDGLAERTLQVLQMPPDEWRRLSDGAYATATGYTWDDATDLFEDALLCLASEERPK
jgi:glycosyltransferase involved in cell wall biosynthesis